MTLDHIAAFVPGAPEWFHLIGRIAAPIFIFCLVVGFDKTRSRRQMLIRLYMLSVAMAVLNTLSNLWLFSRFTVENNIFQTLFCILLFIQLLSESKKKAVLYLSASLIAIISMFLCNAFRIYPLALDPLIGAILGNPFWTEGGFLLVLLGLLMHRFYQDRQKLSVSLMIYFIVLLANSQFSLCGHIAQFIESYFHIFFDTSAFTIEIMLGFQVFPTGMSAVYSTAWVGIFALPLLLLYNGQRGKGLKKFFYLYYPAHIYLLALLRLLHR